MPNEELTGDERCWPCTLANLLAGGLVGGLPLVLVWGQGSTFQLWIASIWALAVLGFTVYRVIDKGYLPGAEAIARATGIHERIGPGQETTQNRQKDEPDR